VALARQFGGSRRSHARTAAWTVAACAALLVLAAAFNRKVTRIRLHTEQHIMLYDLAALSVAQSRNLLPEYLQRRGITLEEMQKTYTPDTSELFLWVDPGRTRSLDDTELHALAVRWRQEILRAPRDYLLHRARAFAALLGIGRPVVYFPFFDGSPPQDPGLSALQKELGVTWRQGSWTLLVIKGLRKLQNSILFRGWIYLLIHVAVIGVVALRRRIAWVPAFVLGTSGTIYLLTYFFVSPTADFRYNWWGCLAGVLQPLIALQCRREERLCGVVEGQSEANATAPVS
jgi:hypothetical protein